MSNIKKIVESIPFERIAFADQTREYRYKDLLDIFSKNKQILNSLRGASVVINGRDRIEFALLLFLLDGIVDRILFLPPDIDIKLYDKYYNEAKIGYEVFLKDEVLNYNVINREYQSIENEFITKWIIPTSGTTNIPKLVVHNLRTLTQTTKKDIELGKKFKWGLVFDIYRFSGIQVFLQSLFSGSTLIITEAKHNMSEIIDILLNNKCNALSATPSFWRKMLMMKESSCLKLKRITLGGEISDDNILNALKNRYPNAKISHIYASTEAGVGFSVTDGKGGFPIEYINNGYENIKMKILNDILWILPNTKGQKYLLDNDLYSNDGYINTGDKVEIKDKRVYFLGRDSGAINVGGNKVQPEEVELCLLSLDVVVAAHVYAIQNPMMGSLVCADIVLSDSSLDKKDIKNLILKSCREKLEGFKVPAILKFVQELEVTHSGKLNRGK